MATRDLNVNIDGDPKGFQRAALKAELAAKRLEGSLSRMEARQKTTQKSASLMRGELLSLAAAATAVAPAAVAAGAGVVAFGALAVPAIMAVVKAQTEMGEQWDTLSTEQKISAAGLRQLIGRYKELAKSVEPETLQSFNAGLGVASSLLPRLAPITKQVARELTAFANEAEDALNSDRADEFFSFLEREAPKVVSALGDAAGSGVNLVMSLTESLSPLATAGIGAVGVVADLVAGLSDMNPELAQAAVLLLALRSPIASVTGMLGKAGGKYTEFVTKTKGASLATKALNLATSAGPNLYVAAGVALAFFAVKAATAESATQKLVARLAVAARATGNNVAGYEMLAGSLRNRLDASLIKSAAVVEAHGQAMQGLGGRVPVVNYEMQRLAREQDQLRQSISLTTEQIANINAGAGALAEKYSITSDEAIRLADAVGVNLSKGILDSGEIAASTAAKFERYRAAVELARDPTAVVSQAWRDLANDGLDLTLQVKALTSALDAYFNPSIAVFNATTAMKSAFTRARDAIKESKGSLDTHSEASRAARDAFAAAAESVSKAAEATYTLTNRNRGSADAAVAARDAVLKQLPGLARLAGSNADARRQVAELAHSYGISGSQAAAAGVKVKSLIAQINRLHNKTITITMITKGTGSTGVYTGGRAFRADGGPVVGPGGPRDDQVPIMASNGEYVVNAAATRRHRGLIEAINADRYADGGLVGPVRGYAAGGQVSDVPLSEFVDRFMGGKAITKGDMSKAIRAHADAVDQLRRAERKLAADRKAHRSAKTIADDEARVRKERRDLATVTEKLRATEAAYAKTRLKPAARLAAALDLGIRNTGAFIANLEKIAARGYPELASALLAMGGPEAEKYAADAAKLSGSKLKALNAKVQQSAKYQAKLDTLPAVFAIKAARKAGATTLPEVMARTGLSEDEISAAYTAMGYARGGLVTGPGTATSDSIPARLSRGEYVVRAAPAAQHRSLLDSINTGRIPAAASTTLAGAIAAGRVHLTIDLLGSDAELKRRIQHMVRVDGGGNVQVTFGRGR